MSLVSPRCTAGHGARWSPGSSQFPPRDRLPLEAWPVTSPGGSAAPFASPYWGDWEQVGLEPPGRASDPSCPRLRSPGTDTGWAPLPSSLQEQDRPLQPGTGFARERMPSNWRVREQLLGKLVCTDVQPSVPAQVGAWELELAAGFGGGSGAV